jgi:CheY-like chemotaxis protein
MTPSLSSAAKVLVIEDDENIRETLGIILRSEGLDVQVAPDGIQALALLRGEFFPSLILVDLMMPNMDGETFIARLKEDPELCRLPVVIMSGHNEVREKALRLSAEAFLVKPVGMEEVLSVVRQFVSCLA